MSTAGPSYFEATARQRIAGLVDEESFTEICGPCQGTCSPSLPHFDLPTADDDGAVVGDARIAGRLVALAAQEGRFMGGAFGEVHSAKIAGLLQRSLRVRPEAFIFLFDSGGVRLQEANAGEIGVTEIMRGVFDLRHAGVAVIGLVGGPRGCFGGAGIVSGCCDALIVSDRGRVGVSGPEVIETTMGAQAFDAHDKALVWRTTGGKNRYLLGAAQRLVEDSIPAFRQAVIETMSVSADYGLRGLSAKRAALAARLDRFGGARDALDIWRALGFANPEAIADMSVEELVARRATFKEGGA